MQAVLYQVHILNIVVLKQQNSQETEQTIPQSIFYESNNLKHVIFPENLKEIGNTAFYGCDSLETVTFPEGLERIGDGAFAYCPNLTEVTIPNSVTYWGSESASGLGNAFEYSGLKTVHLNEGRTEIPSYAFIHCENLTDINIPSTVEKIAIMHLITATAQRVQFFQKVLQVLEWQLLPIQEV